MSSIMNIAFFENLFISMVSMATPLLLVALGELYSERAGLINIGLDGLMTVGACTGFLVGYFTNSPLLGVIAGTAAGIAMNMLYAFCTVTLRAGQIINGMVLNILAPAVTVFIYRMIFGVSGTLVVGPVMEKIEIPFLSKIPLIGKALFNCPPLVYFAVAMTIFTAVFFNKTKPGLNMRAVGEYPRAAATMGVHVERQKYLACIICGALAGIGGAYLTTNYMSAYSEGVVAGRGFIALSAVIFGGWKASGILIATLIFGLADAFQLRLQTILTGVPYQFLAMLPYLFTLFALIFAGNKHAGPKASGKPYFREDQ